MLGYILHANIEHWMLFVFILYWLSWNSGSVPDFYLVDNVFES
jgi:hypothetical protein